MKIVKTGDQTWQNRHETFTENIKDLYELGDEPDLDALSGYNDATQGCLQLISQAIATKTPLRSLGAGWSWMKIATVNNGVMLDTKPLNTVFDITAASVSTAYTGDPQLLLFAQSGNGIWELSAYLKQKGQSLKTSGASNGQTIAGAIGTGAHGSAFDFGAVQDYVVGLHLAVGPTRHIWLERASAPVVSPTFIQNLQTQLVQDDDLFNAVLVSFGSFGIILGVMIETEPLFLLEGYNQRMPYDDSPSGTILKAIMQTLDFTNANLPCGSERPFHFSVMINPYDMTNGAYVTSLYKRPYTSNYKPPSKNPAGLGPADDAAAFIGLLTSVVPALVPTLVNKIIGASLTLYQKQLGTLSEFFNNITLRGKLLSAAVGFPIASVNQVIALMLDLNNNAGPFPGLFCFRFVKQTKATMGFTRFPQTCVMELDAPYSDAVYNFYTQVWQKLEAAGITFTFHWGKVNELDPARIAKMYGDSAKAWIAARNKLLDAATLSTFTNPLMRQWGLDAVL